MLWEEADILKLIVLTELHWKTSLQEHRCILESTKERVLLGTSKCSKTASDPRVKLERLKKSVEQVLHQARRSTRARNLGT